MTAVALLTVKGRLTELAGVSIVKIVTNIRKGILVFTSLALRAEGATVLASLVNSAV